MCVQHPLLLVQYSSFTCIEFCVCLFCKFTIDIENTSAAVLFASSINRECAHVRMYINKVRIRASNVTFICLHFLVNSHIQIYTLNSCMCMCVSVTKSFVGKKEKETFNRHTVCQLAKR